ncbi:MAG: hypothetical protein OXI81_09800 [Paracoccaceae bacterium]|nr:hypothetical protein [Paracoccaceae bacterium]
MRETDLIDCHQMGRTMPKKYSSHPGLSVRHDGLEPLGLSVTDAACRLGISREQLSVMP